MSHDPDVCHVCQTTRAIGIGIGFTHRNDTDPRWLCTECSLMLEDIRKIKRMDVYERRALDRVDDIAGEYCAGIAQTDMAAMSDDTRKQLWKTVVQGYSSALRAEIRDGVPF